MELLQRDQTNDWGDICPADKGLNELALHDGLRIFSVHQLGESIIWIRSDADRNNTAILLPTEY
jgi:hypothetical protein